MVSIVVPIYNQEKYLEKCLQSIKEQTYNNIEVIMVNDGSTDESERICNKYLEDDRYMLYYQKNQGVSVARNLGMKNAKGEWIAFIDPDDYIDKFYLEKLLFYVDDTVDIVSCCCKAFYNDEYHDNLFYSDSFVANNDLEKKKLFLQLMDCEYGQPQKSITAVGVPWGKLYRRSFLEKNSLSFNPNLKRQQDNIFNMKVFQYANSVKYVNLPLYYYRMDNINNYIFSKYDSNAFLNFVEFQKERRIFFEIYGFFDSEIEKYYYNESFNQMVKILNTQFLHIESNMTSKEKREKIILLLDNKYFKDAIDKLNISDLKNKKYKIVFICAKKRMINGILVIWYIKKIIDKLKK